MRIIVAMPSTGLFYAPGLAKPTILETNTLPEAEALELTRLIESANFFRLPASITTPSAKLRDTQQLRITIEDDDRRRTIHVSEPFSDIQDERLRALVEFLCDQGQRMRKGEQTK